MNASLSFATEYDKKVTPIVMPNEGLLLSNDYGTVNTPGNRMSVPGQTLDGIVSLGEQYTLLNLVDTSENNRAVAYLKRNADSSLDINLQFYNSDDYPKVFTRGHQEQFDSVLAYGALAGPVVEYGLLNGKPTVWKCDKYSQECKTLKLERGDYFDASSVPHTYQYEQVIAMGKDASYIITLYNRQVVESSLKELTSTSSQALTQTTITKIDNSSCTGNSCLVVAKATRQGDDSYGKPVPIWQENVSCGLPAIHLNSEATSLVIANDCGADVIYVFTDLDKTPGTQKLKSPSGSLWPVGISSSNTIAFAYTGPKSGELVTNRKITETLVKFEQYLQQNQPDADVNHYNAYSSHTLKRDTDDVLNDSDIQYATADQAVCLVEYSLDSTLTLPDDCPIPVLSKAYSTGNILRVRYLPDGKTGIVSSDTLEGNGILDGASGSRRFTALKTYTEFKQIVSELDDAGIGAASGTDDNFSIAFSANYGGNQFMIHYPPTPTGVLMNFVDNTVPWYRTTTAYMAYIGVAGFVIGAFSITTPAVILTICITASRVNKKHLTLN